MSRLIVTPRLVLRPWRAADLAEALKVYADPQVVRWLPPELTALQTPADVEARLTEWSREDPEGDCVGHWAVAERTSGAVVGAASLQYLQAEGGSLVVSWALAPRDWGHGYAAEAGDHLVRWAIHECGVVEVFALIQPDNVRGRATAERIGMEWVTEVGHLGADDRYQVYRIRHGDLDVEDDEDDENAVDGSDASTPQT